MINELAIILDSCKKDTSGKWISLSDAEKMLNSVIIDICNLVEQTPTSCAFTTYDLAVVTCTIKKATDQIKNKYQINQYESTQ